MNTDTHRCPICAAEFASSEALVRHEKERHAPSSDRRTEQGGATKPRKGREFTRRNFE